MTKPTREVVAEYLDYDPISGEFHWKKPTYRRGRPGELAGAIRNTGRPGRVTQYRHINLFGQRYKAAHIAWVLMTGRWPKQVDHRNNNSLDDRWQNLRLATQTQNQKNSSIRRDNTSGYKGVHPYKRGKRKRWVAQIADHHIGYFATAEEAARAYDAEAIKRFGEFAYLNLPSNGDDK